VSQVPSSLGVVVGTPPTGSLTSCHGQRSESDVVHDDIRLREHQIVAIACIVFAIGAGDVEYAGTTEGGETIGGSSGSSELSSSGDSTEMITDGRPHANRKVLVKRIGGNLLPTTQAWGFGRPCPPVPAPHAPERVIPTCCATSFQVRRWSRNSMISSVEAG
jgi:hypothetical protein